MLSEYPLGRFGTCQRESLYGALPPEWWGEAAFTANFPIESGWQGETMAAGWLGGCDYEDFVVGGEKESGIYGLAQSLHHIWQAGDDVGNVLAAPFPRCPPDSVFMDRFGESGLLISNHEKYRVGTSCCSLPIRGLSRHPMLYRDNHYKVYRVNVTGTTR